MTYSGLVRMRVQKWKNITLSSMECEEPDKPGVHMTPKPMVHVASPPYTSNGSSTPFHGGALTPTVPVTPPTCSILTGRGTHTIISPCPQYVIQHPVSVMRRIMLSSKHVTCTPLMKYRSEVESASFDGTSFTEAETDCGSAENDSWSNSDLSTEEEARETLMETIRKTIEEVKEEQSSLCLHAEETSEKLHALKKSIFAAQVAGLARDDECLLQAESLRRHLHNVKQDLLGAVRVFCRIRPPAVGHAGCLLGEFGPPVTVATGTMSVQVKNHGEFVFDAVFDEDACQEELFSECRNLVQSVVDGYPVTLFCYGQTGAGKTYTMYGNEEHPGIAPRAVSELFHLREEKVDQQEIHIYASMVELYNNDLVDLLKNAGYDHQRIEGQSSSNRRSSKAGSAISKPKHAAIPNRQGFIIKSKSEAIEIECFSEEELSKLLWNGFAQRQVAATAMNGDSSRSHVVFQLRVHSHNLSTHSEHTGYMALVDLGGSERLKKSGSTGEKQKEAIEINRSLSAIGDVVEALARGLRGPQVPYRNHKLTLLLQDALSSSSKTLMVVNVAPSAAHCKETMVALRFGQRAGNVVNRVAGCRGVLSFQSTSQRSPRSMPSKLRSMSSSFKRASEKQLASEDMQPSEPSEHQSSMLSATQSTALPFRCASKKWLASEKMQCSRTAEHLSSRCLLKKLMLTEIHHRCHRRSLKKFTPRSSPKKYYRRSLKKVI
eukprot:gnl/MRDRNA2_/MRDRNA2_117424_c0_seq1.p1 gnl/MRDRNA2_/MRDRNA2_117424_c0~~gnl/MRDRNA2_/MRDRNA2_117424_c0_seq1.p1  ORF type:complete len:757 (-),score=131.91 gnl/MRDRNA2_/MRDRNA2_117424_c0_seq1:630-2780(-)